MLVQEQTARRLESANETLAVICNRLDGPSALEFGLMPRPELKPGQVRIAVRAAGLNFADTLIVYGRYQLKPPLPFVPGLEAAGVVSEVASDVTLFKPGDRVMAALGIGSFAADIVCNATAVFAVPDELDLVTAAGFPIVYGSAHFGLARRARLWPGETLLVLGAAGGLGLAAVELGKAMGASVIAAARGAERVNRAKLHGADHVIDYASEDLKTRVKELTDGRGANVIFDPVGGEIGETALKSIAWEGRFVIAGFASGKFPQIPANILLVKNVTALGLFFGEYRSRDPQAVRGAFGQMAEWLRQGKLRPHVSHSFPASKAGDAMTLLLSRNSTGKIVLTF